MYISVLPMCPTSVLGAHGAKVGTRSPGTELQTTSCHVCFGNPMQVLWKSSKCSYCWASSYLVNRVPTHLFERKCLTEESMRDTNRNFTPCDSNSFCKTITIFNERCHLMNFKLPIRTGWLQSWWFTVSAVNPARFFMNFYLSDTWAIQGYSGTLG